MHRVTPTAFQGDSTSTSKVYDPPVPEFSVLATHLDAGATEKQRAFKGPSVGIVTSGGGKAAWEGGELTLKEGSVFFVGAGTELTVSTGGDSQLVIHRAFNE